MRNNSGGNGITGEEEEAEEEEEEEEEMDMETHPPSFFSPSKP